MIKTIRAKIVWTFAALVLLNLAAGFWAIYNFYALGATVATILHENYVSVLAAENMMKSLERQDNALLVASDPATATVSSNFSENRSFTENRDYFNYWYDQAVRSVTLPAQEPLRDSIQTAFRHYSLYADSMNARIQQGAFGEAKQYYYDLVRPRSDELRELCFGLFEVNQNAMYNAERRIHSVANQIAFGTMMTSIVTLLLSIVAAAWLIKVFITPAEKLTETVKQIGAGKLDLKIDVLSDDEIGQLSREFNKMTERLSRFEQMNIDQIISEKRKSEAIVENISDGLIVTDAAMSILHVNAVIADLFQIDEQDAIGRPVSAVIRDERIIALIRAHAAGGDALPEPKLHYMQFDRRGVPSYFRPKVTRVIDNDGNLFGVLMLLQDVTQFKELDRLKSDFIATLSHEFRTPLTSINMSIDILTQGILGPLNAKQKELIDATKEDCFRLTKLARELLQLSKLESGRLQLRDEELDVASAVEASLRPLQLQFQEKGVLLTTAIEPDLPRLIADPQQLSWIMTNLVTNALKYTGPGGTVSVRVTHRADTLEFEVRDTGQGIAKDDLEKIFDKFVQVNHVSDTTPGSVGLGLAIAKEIVELYGGKIWAESEPGKGSTFFFVLPLRQEQITSGGDRA